MNSVERLNREVKRLLNVVGIFPDREAILRMGGSYLTQQHDSWLSGKIYFTEESMQELMENFKEKKSDVVKLN